MLELKRGATPEFRQSWKNLSPCRSRPQKKKKIKIWSFHFVVEQGRQTNIQKAWCTCRFVVFLTKPIAFWRCRCRRRRRRRRSFVRSLPMEGGGCTQATSRTYFQSRISPPNWYFALKTRVLDSNNTLLLVSRVLGTVNDSTLKPVIKCCMLYMVVRLAIHNHRLLSF